MKEMLDPRLQLRLTQDGTWLRPGRGKVSINVPFRARGGRTLPAAVDLLATGDWTTLVTDGKGVFDNQKFTITAWVYTPASWGAITDYRILFSYDYTSHVSPYYATQLRFSNGGAGGEGKIVFGWNDGSILQTLTSPSAVATASWVRVAAVFMSGRQEIWVNNDLVASSTLANTITFYNQPAWFNKFNVGIGKDLIVEELCYYDAALTAQELTALYQRGAQPAIRYRGSYFSAAAAATTFIPIVGRGPGMSLAENGGGLAGVAQ